MYKPGPRHQFFFSWPNPLALFPPSNLNWALVQIGAPATKIPFLSAISANPTTIRIFIPLWRFEKVASTDSA